MEGIFCLQWRETAIHVQGCRIEIEKTVVDPLFLDLVMDAKASDSRMLKIALRILRTRSRFLCLSFARAIHIARNQFPIFYSKVKAGR